MQEIINKIVEERNRQIDKWGIQDLPSVKGYIPAVYYNIPTMEEAKEVCDDRARIKQLTWADILLEEVCEVVEAPNDENRIEELTQIAAVCISWIENIKQNQLKQNEKSN